MASKDTNKAERKASEAEEHARQLKKFNRNVIIVGVLFVLAVIVVVLFNSNLFYTGIDAVKIGDTGYSAVDFNFFYVNEYNEIYSSISNTVGSDYASYYMPDTSTSLSEQVYNAETGETWADILTDRALARMERVTAVCDAANAAGYTLTEDDIATVDNAMLYLSYYAMYSGTDLSTYLVYMYGDKMTEEIYRENYEKLVLAQSYASYISGGFEYTADELAAEYAANADDFDYVNFYTMFVYADMPEDDSSQEALDAAMESAKTEAETYASMIYDVESFNSQEMDYVLSHADHFLSDTYTIGTLYTNQGTNLPSLFKEWLLDSSRKEGDVEIFASGGEDPTSTENGYYIVMFRDRENNDYNSVNGYYIYIANETVSEDNYETTEEYNAAVASAAEYAQEEAEAILADYESGEYETMDALIETYTYEITENNEFTQVGKHDVNGTVSSWLFDSARKEGDAEVVTASDGAYILFFYGEDENAGDLLAENSLRNADYTEWETAQAEGYEASTGWTMKFTRKINALGA